LQVPSFAFEVDLPFGARVVPLVEEARLLPEELLPLLQFTLSLVDAVHHAAELFLTSDDVRFPILELPEGLLPRLEFPSEGIDPAAEGRLARLQRSEEHPSELQSLAYLVCRL